jgi:regulation of enolase protein 1 (concanavalin A-like superfamily)
LAKNVDFVEKSAFFGRLVPDFSPREPTGLSNKFNDNAHVLYNTIAEKHFSFTVKAEFNFTTLFDQCGIAIYQNSDNWVKTAMEFHDDSAAWLGSVVTNYGYSDWATTDIGVDVKHMYYRLSRRESDYCLENSFDGIMDLFKNLFECGQKPTGS